MPSSSDSDGWTISLCLFRRFLAERKLLIDVLYNLKKLLGLFSV